MKVSCLIIDDEPLARKRLFKLVEAVPELQLLDTCKTGKEAIQKIDSLEPDLIFLDIQMKDMSGFDVLKEIRTSKKPLTIFVTAFDVYAVKAFDFFAFDYLLKPFKKDRFDQSVLKIISHFNSRKELKLNNKIDDLLAYLDQKVVPQKTGSFNSRLPIKTGNSVTFIELDDIKYIRASGSYIDIHTDSKIYVHRSALHQLLDEFQSKNLLRIHRSTIINVNYLEKVVHSNFGELDVKMKDGLLFRISKSYKKEFQKSLGI